MTVNTAKSVNTLSDNELVTSLDSTLNSERVSVATSIKLLGEMVRRDLHTRLGYSSVYAMLTQRFRMSESNASKRAAAVSATRRYPDVLTLVEGGAMNLSNLALIARRLDDTNKDRLVSAACHLTQRQLEEFIVRDAALSGTATPPRRETIRPVAIAPVLPPTFRGNERAQSIRGLFDARAALPATAVPAETTPSETPPATTPMAIGLRVAVTIEGPAKEALDELRRLNPGKSVTDILAEALVAHRDRVTPAARAAAPQRVTKPRPTNDTGTPSGTRVSRYIPKAVRHEVFTRDGGRCTYVAPDGKRCGCDVGIEFDHIRPVAFGGEPTVRNLRLLCRAHNVLAAKDAMGKAFIEGRMSRVGGGY